jgi:hypothetical protein
MQDEFIGERVDRKTGIIQPIGERIIGLVDPRRMSLDEFRVSRELLHHGSGAPFIFSRAIDYSTATGFPGSFTVGKGLYTTPDRRAAEGYSIGRQGGTSFGSRPVFVTEILPYRARMYDFRSEGNTTRNAPLTEEFVTRWHKFYATYFKEKYPDMGKSLTNWDEQSAFNIYSAYYIWLNHFARNYQLGTVDLRQLLRGTGSEENVAGEFTQFMTGLGYDGIIYNEGGDFSSLHEPSLSFVFYNLDRIGTYEVWHEKKVVSQLKDLEE